MARTRALAVLAVAALVCALGPRCAVARQRESIQKHVRAADDEYRKMMEEEHEFVQLWNVRGRPPRARRRGAIARARSRGRRPNPYSSVSAPTRARRPTNK